MPGYDILAQAEAGLMSFTGEPGGGPMRLSDRIADMTCGMYARWEFSRRFLRGKNRRGQFIDMALFDSQLTWLANAGSSYLNANVSPKCWGNAIRISCRTKRTAAATASICGRSRDRGVVEEIRTGDEHSDDIGRDDRFTTNALRIKTPGNTRATAAKYLPAEAGGSVAGKIRAV